MITDVHKSFGENAEQIEAAKPVKKAVGLMASMRRSMTTWGALSTMLIIGSALIAIIDSFGLFAKVIVIVFGLIVVLNSILTLKQGLSAPSRSVVKRFLDIVISSVAILAFSPMLIIIALMIRISEPGPVFFNYRRIGLRGCAFKCFKFRTMRLDAGDVLLQRLINDPAARAEWESTQKLRNDPRITAVGQFLRKTSLDELPQLINVLIGDMSIVGPRPLLDVSIPLYGENFPAYTSVRPGLTGLSQISGRSELSYQARVKLDASYVTNWSILTDLNIIIRTIFFAVNGRREY